MPLLIGLGATLLVGCGDDDARAEQDCEVDIDPPPGIRMVQTVAGEADDGIGTCVLALSGGGTVPDAIAAWSGALGEQGVDHTVVQDGIDGGMIQFTGPSCGVVVVLPAGSQGVFEIPDDDPAVAEEPMGLVSVVDCEAMARLPEAPPRPAR